MERKHLAKSGTDLESLKHLLSHLSGEVAALEAAYGQVLSLLTRLESKFETEAARDDLTGLLRRNAFFERTHALIQECLQTGERSGMLLVDIDHFKRINDTHGHAVGDQVIARVATLLRQFESPNCLAGRYGGEEFVVAVRGTDAEISHLGERIRQSIATDSSSSVPITVSVGFAEVQVAEASSPAAVPSAVGTAVQSADEALYEAKRMGRNQVRKAA